MGYIEISLKLPTDYDDNQIREGIRRDLKISCEEFTFQILHKSLDARKKNDIHWLIRVGVISNCIENSSNGIQDGGAVRSERDATGYSHIPYCKSAFDASYCHSLLGIEYRKRDQKVLVVGSGPAGFFAAYLLQMAGFKTTLVERGARVKERAASIKEFETTGRFNPYANYAFGEGGAGTFSDGKLTSRSKHISKEREFVLSSYVQAGAPEEILYMAHPHLGSDHLKQIVKKLRDAFINIGGTMLFETMVVDLKIKNRRVACVSLSSARSEESEKSNMAQAAVDISSIKSSEEFNYYCEIEADEVVIASGHSAYDTYRMLMAKGVRFRSKSFAIGCRVEHPQELINIAQWGRKSLPGVKAAEYRLTSKGDGKLPVYTFCMCPGGVIVPSTAYETANIVNGMSRYQRNEKFANSACVAGVNLNRLLSKEVTAEESLEWLESLEHYFYSYSSGYAAPVCTIEDFIDNRLQQRSSQSFSALSANSLESSYPLGLKLAPLWELLPVEVSAALRQGLKEFCRKLRGFERGLIMGLESKSSSPVSVVREKSGCCTGFDNLYMAGEGSGHSGGIISSAADGIRAALSIMKKY